MAAPLGLTSDGALLAVFQLDGPPCSIAELFEVCDRQRFTGSVTLHFRNGRPCFADFGKPVRVTLDVVKRGGSNGSD